MTPRIGLSSAVSEPRTPSRYTDTPETGDRNTAPQTVTVLEVAAWLRRVTPRSHDEAQRIHAVITDLEHGAKKS